MPQPYRPRRTCLAVPGGADQRRGDALGLPGRDRGGRGGRANLDVIVLPKVAAPDYPADFMASIGMQASRKLAMVTAAKGRAAGLARRGAAGPGSAEHSPAGQRLG
jgi:hypothetical protein